MKWRGRAAQVLPIALPTLALAWAAIAAIYRKVGHAGATLDDSFIHFQYARAFAELHPFRYQAGEPFTTGATSFVWPALLSIFYAVGFRDVAILWPAWALGFVALSFLAHEARALAAPLAGWVGGVGAAAMVLAFSGFSWCAASGMEVVPFAWILARAARRSSEWAEAPTSDELPTRQRTELLLLAIAAPLVRPEGLVASWTIAAALLAFPRPRMRRGRAYAILALASPLLPMLIAFALTGHPRTNTMVAKLLIGNPYYRGAALWGAFTTNVRILFGTLLNGEVWSAEFLPHGGAGVAMAGLLAIALRGVQTGRRWRAAYLIVLALGMAIPCLYVSFLWNRLRYLWPFASGWIVGLACLARVVGDACARVHRRWRMATPIACGAFVGMLAVHQGWALDDAADSASGIDRQHVALGRWANEHLPLDARIGVNDTGAIAYLGNRRTFDIVGLTTPDEARYWVAGPASRFEHYERLYRETPSVLPTHFIVYPEWMACDAVLGPSLHEVTVTDATILGGTTMRVYQADYSRLGSGELPWTRMTHILDRLDVADLESEEAHAYDLAGARDREQIVHVGLSPSGSEVADGGRTTRTVERFLAALHGQASRGVVRLESDAPTHVQVLANGTDIASFDIPGGDWGETSFLVPATGGEEGVAITLRAEGLLTVYHYWFEGELEGP